MRLAIGPSKGQAWPRLHMDAVLTAHRSLPRTGFIVLLSVLAAYNLLLAVVLLLIGAFPVPIFLGLDFLAVFIAFRVSYRRAGRAERVQVSADQVRVALRIGARERIVWTSPTAFTRVAVERRGEHEARVSLQISRRSLSVGEALSPHERTEFADALESAIASADPNATPSEREACGGRSQSRSLYPNWRRAVDEETFRGASR